MFALFEFRWPSLPSDPLLNLPRFHQQHNTSLLSSLSIAFLLLWPAPATAPPDNLTLGDIAAIRKTPKLLLCLPYVFASGAC